MAFDSLPEISREIIDAHLSTRYRSNSETARLTDSAREYLERNPALRELINLTAQNSRDSPRIFGIAYTLLDIFNSQLEAKELERMME
jgi:hypothetical protein